MKVKLNVISMAELGEIKANRARYPMFYQAPIPGTDYYYNRVMAPNGLKLFYLSMFHNAYIDAVNIAKLIHAMPAVAGEGTLLGKLVVSEVLSLSPVECGSYMDFIGDLKASRSYVFGQLESFQGDAFCDCEEDEKSGQLFRGKFLKGERAQENLLSVLNGEDCSLLSSTWAKLSAKYEVSFSPVMNSAAICCLWAYVVAKFEWPVLYNRLWSALDAQDPLTLEEVNLDLDVKLPALGGSVNLKRAVYSAIASIEKKYPIVKDGVSH